MTHARMTMALAGWLFVQSSIARAQDTPAAPAAAAPAAAQPAPDAQSVVIELGGRYPLTKDENGVWTGATRPLPVGFHYYSVLIDGAAFNDPGTQTFFGVSKWLWAIEVPDPAGGFYQANDVPHVWNVDSNAHDPAHWRNNLYHFVQLLFR